MSTIGIDQMIQNVKSIPRISLIHASLQGGSNHHINYPVEERQCFRFFLASRISASVITKT